ncbi:MAG: PEP-CTERM sorting domain-containing protein [Phycisphaerae bacterium]|nr:PEP-CTERM sorting domain-containing protein [Phycisphaerae bacterium]
MTGTARLSADAVAEAGVYLEDTEDHADIGASIGAGLNLTLTLEADSDLLNGLPRQLRDMLPTEFTFKYPIAGTPTFTAPEIEIPLGGSAFDIDAFRQALADVDPGDEYDTADDVTGTVTILGVPMNLRDTSGDGEPDEASVTIGASASAYAETSATAGVDFFFKEVDEHGQVIHSKSIFETLGHLWNQTVELTDETVTRRETGTVVIHPDGLLELATDLPVWMTTTVDIEEETNLLAFEADFISEEGAEGILQVFWDSELVATIDERMIGDEEETFLFTLSDVFASGTHTLSFRLDPSTAVDSSIVIDNITTGYLVGAFDPLLGDTNGDGVVDDLDYANFVAQFGGLPGEASADFNGDGIVDLEDFVMMRGNFGFGVALAPEQGALAPEPATLSLLALGGLAMLRRRRS